MLLLRTGLIELSFNLFRLRGLSSGFFVCLGKVLDFTLPTVLFMRQHNQSKCVFPNLFQQTGSIYISRREMGDKIWVVTNLPLGESQVHLSAAFGLETRAFLEGPADRASGNGQVAVVAVRERKQNVSD